MNVRQVLASSVLVALAAAWVAAPASAQLASVKASTIPEGAEPYGPVVLLAKEDSVPVRTDPGFVYREIRFLPKGQEVIVDARKGDWLHVRPQGWILAEHLATREQFENPEPFVPSVMVPVRDGIRVRSSPSTDAEISRTLKAGEEVEVTGQEAGWWRLASGGFVAASLLRPAGEEPAPPAAADASEDAEPWVVAAESANVRGERSMTAPIVRRLSRGQVVAVSAVLDGWAEVPGGFVRADLLQPPTPRAQPRPASVGAPQRAGGPMRRWSLVDLTGVIFEVTDISKSPLLPQIKKELKATGVLEEDWTYLGLTIGVPDDAPYRFNYSPDRNTTIIEDLDGQRFGNVYVVGPFEKLPAHVRQFFIGATVNQGEKFDGLLLFKPSLKPENIREIQMFIGGRMQRLFEDTSR